jgi:hypothetical protein
MGSPLLMLLAIYAGADSVDSQTWIVGAAFKYAQIPGGYAVRLARRGYASYRGFRAAIKSFAAKLLQLHTRELFPVKNWKNCELVALDSLSVCEDYAHTLIDLRSNENVHNRACHNLWVYNYEIERYRRAREAGAVEQFLESRMAGTRYDAAFRSLRQRILPCDRSFGKQRRPIGDRRRHAFLAYSGKWGSSGRIYCDSARETRCGQVAEAQFRAVCFKSGLDTR